MPCSIEHEDWPIESCAKSHLTAILRGLRRAAIAGLVLPRACTATKMYNDPFPLSLRKGELLLPLSEVKACVEDIQKDSALLRNLDALLTRATAVAAYEVIEEYLGNTRNVDLRPNDKKAYEKTEIRALGKELRDIFSHSASSTQWPVKANHSFDWLSLSKGDVQVTLQAGSLVSFVTELHNFCEKTFSDAT